MATDGGPIDLAPEARPRSRPSVGAQRVMRPSRRVSGVSGWRRALGPVPGPPRSSWPLRRARRRQEPRLLRRSRSCPRLAPTEAGQPGPTRRSQTTPGGCPATMSGESGPAGRVIRLPSNPLPSAAQRAVSAQAPGCRHHYYSRRRRRLRPHPGRRRPAVGQEPRAAAGCPRVPVWRRAQQAAAQTRRERYWAPGCPPGQRRAPWRRPELRAKQNWSGPGPVQRCPAARQSDWAGPACPVLRQPPRPALRGTQEP